MKLCQDPSKAAKTALGGVAAIRPGGAGPTFSWLVINEDSKNVIQVSSKNKPLKIRLVRVEGKGTLSLEGANSQKKVLGQLPEFQQIFIWAQNGERGFRIPVIFRASLKIYEKD